jgi:hypothetical protein
MSTNLKVLRVKKFPLYDVFQGEGWEQWSRILMKGSKAILIAGEHLSISQLRSLSSTINTKPEPENEPTG